VLDGLAGFGRGLLKRGWQEHQPRVVEHICEPEGRFGERRVEGGGAALAKLLAVEWGEAIP